MCAVVFPTTLFPVQRECTGRPTAWGLG